MKSIQLNIKNLSTFTFRLFPFILFIFLVARNPFSERTLIPNFEPFPDSFHYVTTARCFLAGEGWHLCREGRVINPAVPPLYSVTMLPFFFINNDPRMFYILNVLLGLSSIILLQIILKKLSIAPIIQVLVLTVFVLNSYFTWIPTLAMAENLLIPLFLGGILVFLLPINKFSIILAAIITTSFYATKYAALPQTLVFGIAYTLKIWFENSQKLSKKQIIQFLSLFVVSGFVGALIIIPQDVLKVWLTIKQYLFVASTATASGDDKTLGGAASFFSLAFFKDHFLQYQYVWIGKSTIHFLWRAEPLISNIVGGLGIIGLLIAFKNNKYRGISFLLLALILAQMSFMSLFYSADTRYIITVLPTALIGLALFCQTAFEFLESKINKNINLGIWVLILGICVIFHAGYLKKQIGLNLKYAETPWWYLSIKQMNIFFSSNDYSQPTTHNSQPILITSLPPFLVDFYSNGKYQLIPLSYDHDFQGKRQELWGEYNYEDLLKLYQQFLDEGREVYVTNYGIGNERPRIADFENLKQHFDLELKQEGCYSLCNVWRVTNNEKVKKDQ